MNKALRKLFQLRKALDEYEKEFGLSDYSEVEKAVFSYISSNANVTITSIKNDPYFSKYSLCLLYTSPSPRDGLLSRMPSSA